MSTPLIKHGVLACDCESPSVPLMKQPELVLPRGRFEHPSPSAVHAFGSESFSVDTPLTAAELAAAEVDANVVIFE